MSRREATAASDQKGFEYEMSHKNFLYDLKKKKTKQGLANASDFLAYFHSNKAYKKSKAL